MNAVTHLEKVITGEVSAVTHLEKVIAGETSAVTYTEKVITGEATPITHLQKVIAGEASPVTHLEYVWVGGTPSPTEHEYTGAVPYTFTANGSPLISWRISGNTVQDGTPTPDNPIMPQGTGERTGNLAYGRVDNVNINENGTLARFNGYDVAIGRVELGTVYTVNSFVVAFYTNEPTAIGSVSYDGSRIVGTVGIPTTFTAPITGYVAFRLNIGKQAMLNTGSTPLPYEPFGVKIPISSANTTTPVYLGEVETTRKIKKLVLTGEENWTLSNNRLMYTVKTTKAVSYESVLCTHYTSSKSFIEVYNTTNSTAVTNQGIYVNSGSTDIADFKSYLAAQYANGTPVTVWYVLANPETGIVNEPIRKIGDYADTLSMEQAGVSIPTNNGSTTVDVETTLKPSEVYIKYKGV